MRLLLFIKYPNYFSRVIVTGRDTVLPAFESTNSHIRLCENVSALNKLDRIFSGQATPLADYLAGNSYAIMNERTPVLRRGRKRTEIYFSC